jgi:hypothetical protein
MALPILAPATAGAQDQTATNQADGQAPASINFSGNGSVASNTFDLQPGLAIVTVCGGSSSPATSVVNTISGGIVEARAGGAVARVGGGLAEARACGTIARSSSGGNTGFNVGTQVLAGNSNCGGNTTAEQTQQNAVVTQQGASSSSQRIENRLSTTRCTEKIETNQGTTGTTTNCIGQANTNQNNPNGIDQGETNQEDTNCIDKGDSNLTVRLLGEDGAQVVAVGGNLTNETGLVQGSSQALQTKAGRHALDVRANGPWTLKIEQPRPSSAPQTTRLSGNGKAATGLFKLSRGQHRFEMAHKGNGRFSVQLLDKNGAKVGGKLVDKKGPFDGSTRSVRVPKAGIYLLQVEANGPWTIRLKP